MPNTISVISDKQRDELLSYTDGHFLDVRAKSITPAKLSRTISAFANADGGEIYIGIAENVTLPFPQKWDGIIDPEDATSHIQVFETLFPFGGDYQYTFLSHHEQSG